jgi:hypothetical protein
MNCRKIYKFCVQHVIHSVTKGGIMPLPTKTKRNNAIHADKKGGMKHKDIAIKYDISIGRVYQILNIHFYGIVKNKMKIATEPQRTQRFKRF